MAGITNPQEYYNIAITFGGALLVVAILVYAAFGAQADTTAGRIKTIRDRRDRLKKVRAKDTVQVAKKQSKQFVSDKFSKNIVDQVYKPKEEQISETSMKLSRAGVRDRGAIYRHFFFKLLWAVLLPIGVFLLLYFVIRPGWDATTMLMVIGAAAIVGMMGPDLMLNHRTQKRLLPIKRAFPDALDMMVVCAESGLSIDAAIKRVSQEMHQGAPELAEELALTGVELSFFEDRREALNGLSRRVNLPTVRAFVNTMIQTEKYGTPVAHSLRILSSEFRQERMMDAEAKASALPAKLTVPLILCILPPLMIVLIGPAILQAMDAFRSAQPGKRPVQ
jgi:tight adherence protein C